MKVLFWYFSLMDRLLKAVLVHTLHDSCKSIFYPIATDSKTLRTNQTLNNLNTSHYLIVGNKVYPKRK